MYRLHVWGGLGAQLTGLFVKKYLEREQRQIDLRIFLHHDPNFEFSYTKDGNDLRHSQRDIVVLQDYLVPKHLRSLNYSKKVLFLTHLHKSAIRIRWLMFHLDHMHSLSQWRPSRFFKNLVIAEIILDCSVEDLKYFSSYLNLDFGITPIFVFHWRLGDLHTKSTKSSGNQQAIMDFVLSFLGDASFESKYVFTESPDLAKRLVDGHVRDATSFENAKFFGLDAEAWDILTFGCRARIFVGTYSKLSLWVAAIRSANGHGNRTYLPSGLTGEFYRLFPMFSKGTVQDYPA